jgi:ribosomal protein S18 acetylase RimI-like enzyme
MKQNQIKIRPVKEKDIESISKLHVDVWNETYRGILPDEEIDQRTYSSSKKRWEQALSSPDPCTFSLLAEFDSEIAGFCVASSKPRDDIGYDSELRAINILKKFHRKGIGKFLFMESLNRLQSMGCKNMYLWVAEKNVNAIDFYKKLGCVILNNSKEDKGSVEITLGKKL